MMANRGSLCALAAALAMVITACSDQPVGPASGAVEVSVVTTGASLDTNGYGVTVDGGVGQAVPVNGVVTLDGLSAGSHSVLLTGLAANCASGGAANPRTVEVVAGQTAHVAFSVTCTGPAAALDISGVWDFTSMSVDQSGTAVDTEEGSYDFGQRLTEHIRPGEHLGGSNSIFDLQLSASGALTFYSLPSLLRDWGIPYCEYDATVSRTPPQQMTGRWFCTSSPHGTWEARRAGPLASVTIYPGPIWWLLGDSIRLTAELRDTAGRRVFLRPVTWSSDQPGVAAVVPSGIWTSLTVGATGTATITATADGQRGTTTVTGGVGGLSVSVTPLTDTLGIGATAAFIATVRDAGGTPVNGLTVNWGSANPTVATVTSAGIATALAAGTTSIWAGVENWGGGAQLTVSGPALDVGGGWHFTEDIWGGNYDDYPYYVCSDSGSLVLIQSGVSFTGTANPSGGCADESPRSVTGDLNGRVLSVAAGGCEYVVEVVGTPPDRMTQIAGGACTRDTNLYVQAFRAVRDGSPAALRAAGIVALPRQGDSVRTDARSLRTSRLRRDRRLQRPGQPRGGRG